MAKKLTYKEVKNFIEVESGSGCKLLSTKYINSRHKLKIQCKCGNKFETHLNDFKSNNKRQCNMCGNKNKTQKFSYENIKYFIEVESNSNCKLLSMEYINAESVLQIQCPCGRNYKTNFKNFKHQKKQKCDVCSGVKLDYKYVREYIEKNSTCKLLSKAYKNAKTKLKLQCECGKVFETTFNLFVAKNKRYCNLCSENIRAEKRIFTYKYVKDFIEVTSNSGCKLISEEYVNSLNELTIKCECGNVFYTTFNKFKNKNIRRCNECSNKLIGDSKRKPMNVFIKEVYNLVGNEYTFINNYIDSLTPIACRHNICENIWNVSPSNFLRGRRCPHCTESEGEQSVRKYLENKNIKFQQEYQFNDLLSDKGNQLRFDFAIFDKNNKFNFLVEYDGEFHYRKLYKNDSFEIMQIHDKRKNQYCKDNKIPLIRIPYWQFDRIETILDKWLNKYGLI